MIKLIYKYEDESLNKDDKKQLLNQCKWFGNGNGIVKTDYNGKKYVFIYFYTNVIHEAYLDYDKDKRSIDDLKNTYKDEELFIEIAKKLCSRYKYKNHPLLCYLGEYENGKLLVKSDDVKEACEIWNIKYDRFFHYG
jgi:hypothetical protein